MIVAWLGAILLIVSVAEIIDGSAAKRSGGVGPAIFACVVLALLTGAAARIGLLAEHRFRGRPAPGGLLDGLAQLILRRRPNAPGPGSFAGTGALAAGASAHTPPLSTRHRHHPVSAVLGGLVVVGVLAWVPTQTVVNFVSWERSQSTQNHGIRATAIFLHVTNTKHCERGGCYFTAAAPARLIPPVRGQARTTVHGAGKFTGGAGSSVRILVDRRDLGYAEFAGDPLLVVADWAIFLGLWIFFWGVTGWIVLQTRHRVGRVAL
jgi:hypothetical protein